MTELGERLEYKGSQGLVSSLLRKWGVKPSGMFSVIGYSFKTWANDLNKSRKTCAIRHYVSGDTSYVPGDRPDEDAQLMFFAIRLMIMPSSFCLRA